MKIFIKIFLIYFLIALSSCTNPARIGFYYDDATSTYKPCPNDATVCTSTTVTSCLPFFTPSGNSCQLKSDATICTGFIGSFFYAGATAQVKCKKCATGTSCNNDPTKYTSCLQGYVKDTTLNICIPCLPQCSSCTSRDTCTTCLDSSFKVSNQCQPCNTWIQNCQTCSYDSTSKKQKCTLCMSNYFVESDQKCSACLPNCVSCSSATACDTCASNYYLQQSDNTCVKCSDPNCIQCTSTTCQVCPMYYYLSGNTCVNCPDHCYKCTDSNTCEKCDVQYYKDATSKCTKCSIDNCQTCSQDGGCQACLTDYYPTTTGSCVKCPDENCAQCDQNQLCVLCNQYYKYDTATSKCVLENLCPYNQYNDNGQCKSCQDGCVACIDQYTCLQWQTYGLGVTRVGFYKDGDNYSQCSLNTVLTCTKTHNLKCANYFSFNADKTSCNFDQNQCLNGEFYYNDSTAVIKCSSCPSLVSDCSSTPMTYTTCSLGSFYDTELKICVPCGYFCKSCTNLGTCTTCSSGSVKQNNKCTPCSSQISHCAQCQTLGSCQFCETGYYRESGTSCVKCVDNCYSCYTANQCQTCNSGYYLDSNKQCQKCADGCKTCIDNTYCTVCQDGYKLDYMQCTQCAVTGCKTCSLNVNYCEECQAGTYPSSITECTTCGDNCAQCDLTGKCLKCNPYYKYDNINEICIIDKNCPLGQYLSGNSCLNCQENCFVCKDSTTCYYWNPYYSPATTFTRIGFYKEGDAWKNCPNNAMSCTGMQVLSCATDYKISDDGKTCELIENSCANYGEFIYDTATADIKCKTCPTYVSDCDKTPMNYKTCTTGYFKDTVLNICVPCPYLCQSCTSFESCSICQSGSIKQNSQCVACSSQFPNCNTCTSLGSCSTCESGYHFDSSKSNCVKCEDNCYMCYSTTQCSQCNGGYYLDINKKCQSCGTGCASCEATTGTCKSCSSGYRLGADNTCTKCSVTNCIQCSQDIAYCEVCASSTYPKTITECAQCPDNCEQCDLNNKCLQCNPYYKYNVATAACEIDQQCPIGQYKDGNVCKPCQDNCDVCSSDTNCIYWNKQYKGGAVLTRVGFYYNKYQGIYIKCPNNALSCNSENVLSCAPYYKPNTDSTECILDGTCTLPSFSYAQATATIKCKTCPQFVATCQDIPMTYTTCQTGYFLDVNLDICAPCGYLCAECTSYAQCRICSNQAIINSSTKQCQACYSQVDNCLTCETLGTCKTCQPGYYRVTTTSCVKCSDNCDSCLSLDKCQKCSSGYITDSFYKCVSCPSNCAACSNQNTCTKCNSGFRLANGSCEACTVENCLQCSQDKDYCEACNAGTYPTKENICEKCPDNCAQCDQTLKCLKCNSYFKYESASNTCVIDQKCPPKYYQSGASCLPCQDNCIFCTDASNCIYWDTYYEREIWRTGFDENDNQCPDNSLRCTTSLVISCRPFYKLSADRQSCIYDETQCELASTYGTFNFDCSSEIECKSCPTYVKDCDKNPYAYQTCIDGAYKDDTGICVPCQYMCEKCTSAKDCQRCNQLSIWDNSNAKCVTCDSKVANCQICLELDVCSVCKSGYFKTNNGATCVSCGTNCDTCKSATACSICASGFYATAEFKCVACSQNCLKCSDESTCTTCSDGYRLDPTTNTCQACTVTNCKSCPKSVDYCEECNLQTYPTKTNACEKCPTNCQQCDQNLKCLQCQTYYQYQNTTNTCVIHDKCPIGYYKSGTTCSPCQKHCDICTGGTYCVICNPLYNDCTYQSTGFSEHLKTTFILFITLFFIIFY